MEYFDEAARKFLQLWKSRSILHQLPVYECLRVRNKWRGYGKGTANYKREGSECFLEETRWKLFVELRNELEANFEKTVSKWGGRINKEKHYQILIIVLIARLTYCKEK